jgi:hypothetical protein
MNPAATTMVRALFLMMISLATAIGQAQIRLVQTDLPKAGDTLRYFSVDPATPGLNTAISGPGYTWDFSWLSPQSAEADTFLSITATNPTYQLFFFNAANHATRTSLNLDLGGIEVTDAFSFFHSLPDKYEIAGFGAIVSGFPLPIRYDFPEVVMRFPLTFGDTSSSRSYFTLPIPGLATISRQLQRFNQVDGWGTLIIPSGTYEVLRVKSTITTFDTITLDMFPFPIPIQGTQSEYSWYAKGGGIPALRIVQVSGFLAPPTISEIRYSDTIRYIPEVHIPPITGFLLIPNPSGYTDPARLLWDQDKEGFLAISVYDMAGRSVWEAGMQKYQPGRQIHHLPQLPSGQYLVHLKSPDEQTVLKWIVAN